MCEDAPCCGCCGNDWGGVYRNEYAIDDYYDGFGPEVDERCQECDEYPEDCICCEGDCPKSQGCPRCSYNNDEEDEEEE